MTKPVVYVETTIPSAFYSVRTTSLELVRKDFTQRWWQQSQERYDLTVSVAVIDELKRGPAQFSHLWLELVSKLRPLDINTDIVAILQSYLQHKLMPKDPGGDALHLALASYHKCDFLLTWNCKHLANANKFGQIRRVNSSLGLYTPAIVTPEQMLEKSL